MTNTPITKKRRYSVDAEDVDTPSTSNLLIKRLSDKAKLPTRGSALAAGYDLYRCASGLCFSSVLIDAFSLRSAEKKIIPARGKALVDTQLSIAVPAGTYGRVAPRSGLGARSYHRNHFSSVLQLF